MNKKLMLSMSLGLALAGTAVAGGGGQPATGTQAQQCRSIAQLVAADPQFSTLQQALNAAGLVDTFRGGGPFTVFAPTNAAFAKLPNNVLENLLNDRAALTRVLTYHVVPGRVTAAQVVNLNSARTLAGENVAIRVEGGMVKLSDPNIMSTNVTVTRADINACNGVIHVIDGVLIPPGMTLGLDMPADVQTPADTEEVAELPAELTNSISDVVGLDPRFATLKAAMEAGNLTKAFDAPGMYTFFAPTEEAFAAVPKEQLDALLANQDQLFYVLTYHAVPETLTAQQLAGMQNVMALQGSPLPVNFAGANRQVGPAMVIGEPIVTENGIIYPINAVLLPPS